MSKMTMIVFGFLAVWFAAVLGYGLFRSVTSREEPLPLAEPPPGH